MKTPSTMAATAMIKRILDSSCFHENEFIGGKSSGTGGGGAVSVSSMAYGSESLRHFQRQRHNYQSDL